MGSVPSKRRPILHRERRGVRGKREGGKVVEGQYVQISKRMFILPLKTKIQRLIYHTVDFYF